MNRIAPHASFAQPLASHTLKTILEYFLNCLDFAKKKNWVRDNVKCYEDIPIFPTSNILTSDFIMASSLHSTSYFNHGLLD